MAERDAFGREKDEDPLAGLGWRAGTGAGGSTPASAGPPPAAPVPAPSRSAAAAAAATTTRTAAASFGEPAATSPQRTARRRRGGGPLRLVLALLPIAVVAGIVLSVASLVDSTSNTARKAIKDVSSGLAEKPVTPAAPGATPESPSAPRPAPAPPATTTPAAGLHRGSLLLRANFGAAIRHLRTGGYGRLTNLRVAPDRIDATMVTKGGRLRSIQVQPGGAVRQFSLSGAGFGGARTMPMGDIDPVAPFRLTRSAAGRLRKPATAVNYLVYSLAFGPTGRWYVYFKGGQIFAADAHGRITRRIG